VQNAGAVTSAHTLADRIDALADALGVAGVAPDRIATILASAAAATMNALLLDAVLEQNRHPGRPDARPDAPLRVAA
jgi:hypothetical protein